MDGKYTGLFHEHCLRHENRSEQRTGSSLPSWKRRGSNLDKHGAAGAVFVNATPEQRPQPEVTLFSLVFAAFSVLVSFVTQPAPS